MCERAKNLCWYRELEKLATSQSRALCLVHQHSQFLIVLTRSEHRNFWFLLTLLSLNFPLRLASWDHKLIANQPLNWLLFCITLHDLHTASIGTFPVSLTHSFLIMKPSTPKQKVLQSSLISCRRRQRPSESLPQFMIFMHQSKNDGKNRHRAFIRFYLLDFIRINIELFIALCRIVFRLNYRELNFASMLMTLLKC